jgi:hypothetical protein
MILYETEYLKFIQDKGVGKNDKVASSPDSSVYSPTAKAIGGGQFAHED